jgi:phosphoglycolate phosphatase-like HAD superfamily hydrolase
MGYGAVILDTDGVLTERTSSEVWRAAARAAFAAFDVDPTTEGVDGVRHGSLSRVRRVCELHDVPVESFWSLYEARAAAAQRRALEAGRKPLYDDVEVLFELGCDLAIVSNNQHRTVEHVLDVYGLDGLFAVVYGREPSLDAVQLKKPSPHYVRRALDDLGLALAVGPGLDADRGSDAALYVGDSNVDVLAARRAGIDSAFVRRPHRRGYELAAEPTYEFESLHDLRAVC